jgi:hypothetical protein
MGPKLEMVGSGLPGDSRQFRSLLLSSQAFLSAPRYSWRGRFMVIYLVAKSANVGG